MVWIYIFSKCNRLQLCLQFRCSLDVSTYGFLCCLNTMEIRSFLELFKSFKRSNKHFERVSRFFFHVFFFSRFFFHIFFSCFQRLNKFNIFCLGDCDIFPTQTSHAFSTFCRDFHVRVSLETLRWNFNVKFRMVTFIVLDQFNMFPLSLFFFYS